MNGTDPRTLGVVVLKKILKQRGLSTAGTKAELISRLMSDDPSGGWMQTMGARAEEMMYLMGGNDDGAHGRSFNESEELHRPREELNDGWEPQMYRREMEIYRREKELAERELALARREIEMLRLMQSGGTTSMPAEVAGRNTPGNRRTSGEMSNANQRLFGEENDSLVRSTKVNVKAVTDLLCYFDGDAETIETWEKQVRFLSAAYKLNNDLTKILIGMRLKGRASEWFHSKPEYIEMTPDAILDGLRGMFYHRPNKIVMRRRFEERSWKKNETFHDYVHEKTIMANRFTTKDQILQAFEEISLKDRVYPMTAVNSKSNDNKKRKNDKSGDNAVSGKGALSDGKGSEERRDRGTTRRCFSCGSKDHVSLNCPTKEKGVKCFGCNEYGHVASK
ncbi:hypothetical protein ALC62_11471 [Cyphomyrmex costatus]|uniref:CCHC-type domain-containing protein n=1 Tax=Cyphomyrmex costatus TaxID=456900 RepID=A0A151ICM6_9HYME|nr:hypothetical protein ALC62_11471 [Cyphomyrmex costatus]